MSLEIEVKVKVESFEAVRARLAAVAATFRGRVLESNEIFDRPDRSLYAADQGIRVRTTSTLEEPGESNVALTFKGAKLPSDFKSRPEWEVGVSDAETTTRILNELGLERVIRFEKQRETWTYSDCRIELDELPLLGSFVEIEGPSTQHVATARTALQLDSLPTIKETYIAMLIDTCNQRGLSPDDVRF